MKIYTKLGDKGETSLLGKRLLKSDSYFKVLGEIDNANCLIGMLVHAVQKSDASFNYQFLQEIQSLLLDLGSYIAGYNVEVEIFNSFIHEIEQNIDTMEEQNIKITNFILPGGSEPSCYAHITRVSIRNVERLLVELINEKNLDLSPVVCAFINRLSDYFFVLARFLNNFGKDDIIYKSANINKKNK